MMHLLALLDAKPLSGTHGTHGEPVQSPRPPTRNIVEKQNAKQPGTLGTSGTPNFEQSAEAYDLANLIADLADAYAERIAICVECGDITEAEARSIAEAEVGSELARRLRWEPRT